MWFYRVIKGLILSCGPHCAVLLNPEVYQVWFSANDRYAIQALFFFHPYQAFNTVQHQAKRSRQTAVCARRQKPLSDLWLFFMRIWANWAQCRDSQLRKKTNSYEVMLRMYCTWEAAPQGWMWLVSCPGLLAPLWVGSFICTESRGVWRGFCEALWWHVGKHCSS